MATILLANEAWGRALAIYVYILHFFVEVKFVRLLLKIMRKSLFLAIYNILNKYMIFIPSNFLHGLLNCRFRYAMSCFVSLSVCITHILWLKTIQHTFSVINQLPIFTPITTFLLQSMYNFWCISFNDDLLRPHISTKLMMHKPPLLLGQLHITLKYA